MKKKILDGTVTAFFCMGLIAASNVQEKNKEAFPMETTVVRTYETSQVEGADYSVAAGVSRIFSGYSFTTESEGNVEIEKKQIAMVATPEVMNVNLIAAQNVAISTPGAMVYSAEGEVVEAGLARAVVQQPEEETVEAAAPVQQNRWNINLTEEEIELLARIVWLEAKGESSYGQEAVVEVIFNRVASDLFPNTLYDVLSQKNPTQFCSWKNRDKAQPTEKEYQAIENVLNGNTNILRNDTLYFSVKPLTSRVDVHIGGHNFCY